MSNQSVNVADVVRCSPRIREPLTPEEARDLAAVFKALADPVRLQLLSLIAGHDGGEACVCDIAPAVDVSQPTISHHLKVLRDAGLLVSQRRASWVYYRVVPDALHTVAASLLPQTSDAAS
ncbi:metalloregulator ArsR/SmtB family transcription factor [Gordonia sp. PP30]|uniref:ArsR/SmtB family transcription factor n=1 Tax=unclassified Gordonia (in: high G+C Gram-positive bacteria) TaxID=2657482 RepID=UPI001FFF0C4D|nr:MULTISPECIES: metalloregulator ArsR/SmtB family transcription factor [unclassified Gordonia (in: high G+C Gram-positive bacteria)]UQE76827.1 metalloregulator ArsR/SmtB family transcription factor [Gordonia sp. PP30]